jgi:cysteine desulfurase
MRTVYLDYNATTPLDRAVRQTMLPFLDGIEGNPSSIHRLGRQARALLDDARERLAACWQCRPGEVVFTSGGTESNNLAILGTARGLRDRGRHLVTTAVEHHAVLRPCEYLARREGFALTIVPVDHAGRVDPEVVRAALRPETVLVSVMAANNEVGTLQPVTEIGALCRERGVAFHTDAAQWFGKEPFASIHQFNAGLVSVCAHKFHGPRGAGALYLRSPLQLEPILFGGGQENERRPGTENVAAIMGFVEAFVRFVPTPVFAAAQLAPLADQLRSRLAAIPGVQVCSPATQCLVNTVSVTFEDCDSLSLLAGLDLAGVCASSGAACSSGSLPASHVLLAMGCGVSAANGLIRFSLGRESLLEDVELAAATLAAVVGQIRRNQ